MHNVLALDYLYAVHYPLADSYGVVLDEAHYAVYLFVMWDVVGRNE